MPNLDSKTVDAMERPHPVTDSPAQLKRMADYLRNRPAPMNGR